MYSNFSLYGYYKLIELYNLNSIGPMEKSYISNKSKIEIYEENGITIKLYPQIYATEDSFIGHILFALKNEGINLSIISELFDNVDKTEIISFIKSKPFSKYSRMIWFLYEWLKDEELPIEKLKQGNYQKVLDNKKYYTLPTNLSKKNKRMRIENNLLGPRGFCPIIKKTSSLTNYENKNLDNLASKLLSNYSEALLHRAIHFLYTKETKSSFEIEHEYPDNRRTNKFVNLLKNKNYSSISIQKLIELQKKIVDERFAIDGIRDFQNYIGESISYNDELIHYIPPKLEDINSFMEDWITLYKNMIKSDINPVIIASTIGFSFVFLHPFDDGNGRLHRYLIHRVLAETKFTPKDIILPISATMLKQNHKYDKALEDVSRKIMEKIEYSMNSNGELFVKNETKELYKYLDLTLQAELLFEFIEDTINYEMKKELDYLQRFDKIKIKIKEIIDIPDRKLNLFIRLGLENNGAIAKRKLKHFNMLTEDEINNFSIIIQNN